MDAIIEFLVSNIYIVFIVLFLLSRLFSKPGAQKKPTQMPDFGGGGQNTMPMQPKPVQAKREAPRQQEPHSAQQVYRSQPEPPSERPVYRSQVEPERMTEEPETFLDMPAYAVSETTGVRNSRQSASSRSNNTTNQSKRSTDIVNRKDALTSNDIRKAIVWSEILGQPRSKRPYQR